MLTNDSGPENPSSGQKGSQAFNLVQPSNNVEIVAEGDGVLQISKW